MTGEPHREYIITEKELQDLKNFAEDIFTTQAVVICSNVRRCSIPLISVEKERIRKFPSSSDLLLIAHDEWKRREKRKHVHDEIPWVHGWITGYLTSDEFIQKRLKKLRQEHKR